MARPRLCLLSLSVCVCDCDQLEAKLQHISAPPGHMRGVLKPLTQTGMLKTADWIGLSQMGYLLYLRMCHVPWQYSAQRGRNYTFFLQHYHQVEAMAELTNYLDALLSPTLDKAQMAYITQQRRVAEWCFYTHFPREQHRLLAHALFGHLADQAVEYGPQSLYWMFPMERSAHNRTHAAPSLRSHCSALPRLIAEFSRCARG